jgi:hypothetical protein
MQRTRAANKRRLIDGRQALQLRAADLPTPMRRSEQRQAAGLVAGLKGTIRVGMPVVALLSLFIDIKSAASDLRFRGADSTGQRNTF